MATTIPELQRRLVFALLRPATRLCARVRMPLKLVEQLVRLAYFEELRRRDISHADIAEVFQKSLRTVGTLEQQSRSGFLTPQREIELCRRIEEAVKDEPLTYEQLLERFPDGESVIAVLRTTQRIEPDPSDPGLGYRLNRRFVSVMRDDMDARIGGLIHQLDVITDTVRHRFLNADDTPKPSIARTLTFEGTAKEVEEMTVALARMTRALCVDTEERSVGQEGKSDYAIVYALTPSEPETS